MTKKSASLAASILLVLVAWPAGRYLKSKPWDSLIKRAYRACAECGLSPDTVGKLITELEHTTLTHDQAVELFRETFDKPENAELCLPCAEAVVEAAK